MYLCGDQSLMPPFLYSTHLVFIVCLSLSLSLARCLMFFLSLSPSHRLNMFLSSREMDHQAKCSGVSTTGFHFVNILLHASVVQLIFLLLRQESNFGLQYEFMTSAYFAVHPIHTEAVSICFTITLLPYSRFLFHQFPLLHSCLTNNRPHNPDRLILR